mgnify:CR=1 FL=1
MIKRYILDHRYTIDQKVYLRVIDMDLDVKEVKEIIAAILFHYEDSVHDLEELRHTEPTLDSVIAVLCHSFGATVIDREVIADQIPFTLEQVRFNDYRSSKANRCDINDRSATMWYLDMFETRESHCGSEHVNKLYKKWLTDDIREVMKRLLITQV